VRNDFGWFFIYIIGILMAFNFGVMVVAVIQDTIAKRKVNKAKAEWAQKQMQYAQLLAKNKEIKAQIKQIYRE
jgi:cell division protein FtsB